MKSSAPSLALGALLLTSLAGKLLANRAPPEPDQALFAARTEAGLRAQGYVTRLDRRPFGILVRADKGACRILVADYAAHGTFADAIGRHAASIGPVRYVWRGSTYDKAPKLRPLGEFYLRREMLRVGLSAPRAPIAAVATTPGCAAPDLSALALLPS